MSPLAQESTYIVLKKFTPISYYKSMVKLIVSLLVCELASGANSAFTLDSKIRSYSHCLIGILSLAYFRLTFLVMKEVTVQE